MFTKVQRWGNSQGLRFSKAILEEARIAVGDEVEVTVHEGAIMVRPGSNVRAKFELTELVSELPAKYRVSEEDWGTPSGNEVW